VRFSDEEPQRRNRTAKSESIRTESHMNRSKRSILARASRSLLIECRKHHEKTPPAPRRAFVRGIGDLEVGTGDSFARTEGLVYAALRVWELKHGVGD
jgi:hypothetical protein